MRNNVTMRGKDSVSAKLAECFITIGGNRYNFMQAIDFEANFEKTKVRLPVLDKTDTKNKSTGWRGTGNATFHYNSSVFRDMMLRFKDKGDDVYFEIQVSNCDSANSSERQTLVFVDCNIVGGILAKFNENSEYLDEKLEFTFEDFRMPNRFKALGSKPKTKKEIEMENKTVKNKYEIYQSRHLEVEAENESQAMQIVNNTWKLAPEFSENGIKLTYESSSLVNSMDNDKSEDMTRYLLCFDGRYVMSYKGCIDYTYSTDKARMFVSRAEAFNTAYEIVCDSELNKNLFKVIKVDITFNVVDERKCFDDEFIEE
jgi:hypothetical protein